MTQLTLFSDATKPKLARSSDPQSSHDAAAKVDSETCEERFFEVLQAHGPMTAKEVAAICVSNWEPELLGREYMDRFETYRKRSSRLKNGDPKRGVPKRIEKTGEKRNGCDVLKVKGVRRC